MSLWVPNEMSPNFSIVGYVSFKILEKLIYARVEPIMVPLLRQEKAGFRHGSSTIDQVILLMQDIEDSFLAKKKAGPLFVDLTAACDTVWQCGLTCKLLWLPPDRHMVRLIMELVSNCSFTHTTYNNKRSRLRCLKNGAPQGSISEPFILHLHLWLTNYHL